MNLQTMNVFVFQMFVLIEPAVTQEVRYPFKRQREQKLVMSQKLQCMTTTRVAVVGNDSIFHCLFTKMSASIDVLSILAWIPLKTVEYREDLRLSFFLQDPSSARNWWLIESRGRSKKGLRSDTFESFPKEKKDSSHRRDIFQQASYTGWLPETKGQLLDQSILTRLRLKGFQERHKQDIRVSLPRDHRPHLTGLLHRPVFPTLIESWREATGKGEKQNKNRKPKKVRICA